MRDSSQVLFALTQDVQHCDHTLPFNCQLDVESPFSDFSGVIKKNYLAGRWWMPCQNLSRVPRFQPHVDQHTRLIPVGNKSACVDLFFFNSWGDVKRQISHRGVKSPVRLVFAESVYTLWTDCLQ